MRNNLRRPKLASLTKNGYRPGVVKPAVTRKAPISRSPVMPKVARNATAVAAEVGGVLAGGSPLSMGVGSLFKLMVFNDLMKGKDSYVLDKVGGIANNIGDYVKNRKPSSASGSPGAADVKIVPTEEGIGALRGTFMGIGVGNSSARVIKFKDAYYDGPKDAKLKLASKLYGNTTVNYFSTEKSIYNRLYAYSGLNTKGLFQPYASIATPVEYTNIFVTNPTALESTSNLGESLYDDSLMLKASLVGTVGAPTVLTPMPPLGAGDIDYYYPIQKWRSCIKVMNTNSFLPVTVKIYTVQAKRDTNYSPMQTWFQYVPDTKSSAFMNNTYVTYVGTPEPITGLPNAMTTLNLHPQASPGMSAYFKDTYRILSLRTFVLKASDQLEYEFTRHFGNSTSAAKYNQTKKEGAFRHNGQIDFMIEFQGPPTPYYKTLTGGAVEYSGLSHCSFSKIRVTVDKSFTHSFPLSGGLGLYQPTSAQYTPSFVGTRQIPLKLYDDKAPYADFATASTTTAGKYVIPIVSSETRQSAQPQVVDPV